MKNFYVSYEANQILKKKLLKIIMYVTERAVVMFSFFDL